MFGEGDVISGTKEGGITKERTGEEKERRGNSYYKVINLRREGIEKG